MVFELSPRAGAYNYAVLHQFCRQKGCPDGSASGSNLIVDKKGNLYGTTEAGGTQDGGTMFELSRTKGKWTYAVLYDFCTKRHCADGRLPGSHIAYAGQASGQPYDGTSAIYGTTLSGGNSPDIAGGAGVAFELDSISGSQRRSESSLHVFCLKAGCSDGAVPFGVILDASGKLYGATVQGGVNNKGTVFMLDPASRKETVLHAFCSKPSCADGSGPSGQPAVDAHGNLFGTTRFGGGANEGVVFRISLSKGAPFKETVLHSFCAQSGCPDGAQPLSGITIAKNGDLYGTTEFGNAFSGGNCQGSGLGCGTAFRLRNGVLTVLYNFCPQGPQSGCPEGAEPSSGPPLLDTAGDVIGSTFAGGVNSPTAGKGGTIFELTQ